MREMEIKESDEAIPHPERRDCFAGARNDDTEVIMSPAGLLTYPAYLSDTGESPVSPFWKRGIFNVPTSKTRRLPLSGVERGE
jgi:hypothetical protein